MHPYFSYMVRFLIYLLNATKYQGQIEFSILYKALCDFAEQSHKVLLNDFFEILLDLRQTCCPHSAYILFYLRNK